MTRKLLAVSSLLCLLALTSQAADDKKTDKEKLQGTWVLTALVEKGKTTEIPQEKETATITFKDDKTTSHYPGKNKDEEGTFTIDEKKHTIDLSHPSTNDPKMPYTVLAIYSLDGDTLKIGFSTKDETGKRPKGFDDENCGTTIYKRMKK